MVTIKRGARKGSERTRATRSAPQLSHSESNKGSSKHTWCLEPRDAIAAYQEFLIALDTPTALTVFKLLEYGEFDQLVLKKIDPLWYDSVESFRKDYQAVKGLSKSVFLPTTIDRRQAAVDKFWEAERQCAVSNVKFDLLQTSEGLAALLSDDPEMFAMLERARNLIKRILGRCPENGRLDFRFGPGATDLVKNDITLPKKYARRVTLTPDLFPFLPDLIGPKWLGELHEVTLVKGNNVSFVPKNAKTERAIAIEPHLNVYAQLGVGKLIAERFSNYIGLDFKKFGPTWNRVLASLAQEWGLATVDLSSASDTIGRSLVWYLLPEEWATLLDDVRSKFFNLEGKTFESEKFSSMGNGATFELETVIFYALTRAAGSSRALTNAFGDDIICESSTYPQVVRLLEFCGFTVNNDKSFSTGRFFESCGSDFFDGVDVRPFFWSKIQEDSVYKFANDISRFASIRVSEYWSFRDCAFFKAHKVLVRRTPQRLRLSIPQGYDDCGFWAEFDEATPRRLGKGWDGWSTKALQFRPLHQLYAGSPNGLLAALDTGSIQSRAPVRGRGRWVVADLDTFGVWVGPGPWL